MTGCRSCSCCPFAGAPAQLRARPLRCIRRKRRRKRRLRRKPFPPPPLSSRSRFCFLLFLLRGFAFSLFGTQQCRQATAQTTRPKRQICSFWDSSPPQTASLSLRCPFSHGHFWVTNVAAGCVTPCSASRSAGALQWGKSFEAQQPSLVTTCSHGSPLSPSAHQSRPCSGFRPELSLLNVELAAATESTCEC